MRITACRLKFAFAFYQPLAAVRPNSIYRGTGVHANLRGWHPNASQPEAIGPPFVAKRRANYDCVQLHTATFFRHALFRSNDQAVASLFQARMTFSREIQRAAMRNALRRAGGLVLVSLHLNKGGTTVDHTLRLDVLAVCAVFVFVGAVLLGAF
jgi:hypothetical protein